MNDAREHARYFLGRADKYIGLRQAAVAIRDAQPDISKWKTGELGRWCIDQALHIAGTKSVDEVVRNDDVLTLTAIGYLAAIEVEDPEAPKSPTMPTPHRLSRLEDGFLRTLLEEGKRDAAVVPEWRDRLEKAKASVSQLVQSLAPVAAPGVTVTPQADNSWAVVDVLAVICAVAGVVAGLTKKKT